MSGDKRSVATDALETLGTIFEKGTGKRDAIHVAVEPVIAGHDLLAGDDISVKDGIAISAEDGKGVGIVDPFLEYIVRKGESFWCLLYPRTIKSLRHVWSHPDFPDAEFHEEQIVTAQDKAESEEWLRDFCDRTDCPGYETVMNVVKSCHENGSYRDEKEDTGAYLDGEYFRFNGMDARGEIPPEFWDHVEVVLGVKIKNRATWFSCSC
jgi:hypothetical protein